MLAEEGETLPMGAPIAELETSESPIGPAPSPMPVAQPAEDPATPPTVGTTGYLLKDVTPVGPTGGAAIEAAEPTMGAAGAARVSTYPSAPKRPTPVADGITAAAPATGIVRLSPAVRRLADEHSLDVSQISGTGTGGRITRDDVLKFLEQDTAATIDPNPATQPQPSGEEEFLPLTPVRRMIADAMVRSVTEIPHAWSTVEIDVTNLVALRASVREAFLQEEGVTLTYLPFVIRAVVESLRKFPTKNATWGGDKIILKKRVNLGIAVAAPNGLIVPVIHDADQLSVAGLSKAVADISERARTNKLAIADVQGGTFTLNNTGALGSFVSGPIINYPQAGIITTETIQKRAVVRDDAIAIRSMMNICLSFDHRINDGAEASGFLEAVKSRLQSMGPDFSVY